ncbi:unnamed protein product [Vitrella brassicaformis CCMP3155]|uniref:FAD-binding domain-containing protein n=1 Tax=Vitrella brassicaformis (strain CCMP3155) TaxID=1169540 RepID=A0A0G4EVU2_VITBC|nr:unnamed protein product [Vitrella brassicaformis CCMP3155]|eukprot:CEM02547.1 unnamed protein product [Vitrella brassicaformis CCMP3155]
MQLRLLLSAVALPAFIAAGKPSDANRPVVIAGGGPAALASAAMLARRGFANIHLLEKMTKDEYLRATDRSYAMGVSHRGQAALQDLGFDLDCLEREAAVTPSNATIIRPDGLEVVVNMSAGGRRRSRSPPNRLLTRQTLTRLMYRDLMARFPRIKMTFGAKVVGCNVANLDHPSKTATVRYQLDSETAPRAIGDAQLIIAADGANSRIAAHVAEVDPSFQQHQLASEGRFAGGLDRRYKVIAFPPAFDVDVTTTRRRGVLGRRRAEEKSATLHIVPSGSVLIRQDPTMCRGPTDRLLLYIFQTVAKYSRVGMIIAHKDHPILHCTSAEKFYTVLQRYFPQWRNVRQAISRSEAERYVKKRVGHFQPPRHLNRLHVRQRVAFVGDAAHSFPPDLGQGANAALEDVVVLDRCLRETNNCLAEALPLFSRQRAPDAHAIAHLAWRFKMGGSSTPLLQRIRWRTDFVLRLALSRLLPFLFSPPVFLMIGERGLSYTEVWKRAERAGRRMRYAAVLVAAALVKALLLLV